MTVLKNYINGEFVLADEVIDVVSPSSLEVLAKAPESSDSQVDAALAAARAAQPGWAALTNSQRAEYLVRLASLVRERAAEFTDILVAEQGKVRALAEVEVLFTADYLDYMAGFARRIEGEILPSDRPGERIFLEYQPLGVVVGILPWNFPFFLIARKLAPALLTGNTIVLKPSEETPINAFRFCELVDEAGVPAGVVNMVGGRGATVGHRLVSSPEVDLVSMTGSVGVGKAIMAAAAPNLTRVNLELGGKAPAIVLADADLDLAAEAIWQSRVINTGQVCNCAEVVLVEDSVHDALVERLVARMAGTRFGDPVAVEELDMGPLINAGAVVKVGEMVSAAVAAGCEVAYETPVDALPERGHFFGPVVLTGVRPEMDVARKEIFGPVLPVVRVRDLDEAIAIANASDYGLTSSVYTRDVNAALKASRLLQYGETYINRENFEAMQGFHAGRRNSGIGGADGKHGLLEYVETHVTYIQEH